MLTTIAVILLILWLLGLITSYTIGGFIHLLLVVAVIMVLIRLIRGENPIK
ncbi:MAG: lmo0937 family membrane protein [bacterium]|nr:lmo0937 family membrane protein [bacterium]